MCRDSEGILTARRRDFCVLSPLSVTLCHFQSDCSPQRRYERVCVLIYDLAAPIKVGERSVAINVWQQRQQRNGEMNSYVKEPKGRNGGDLCSAGRHGTHRHGNRPCAIAPSSSSFPASPLLPPLSTVIEGEMTSSFLVAKPPRVHRNTSPLPLISIHCFRLLSSFHLFTAATSLLLNDHSSSFLDVVPICFVSTK